MSGTEPVAEADADAGQLAQRLGARRSRLALDAIRPVVPRLPVQGRLTVSRGTVLEAAGCRLPIGARCRIEADGHTAEQGDRALPLDTDGIEAEVIGFDGTTTVLMPIRAGAVARPGARVTPLPGRASGPFDVALLGRIIDADGEPLDGGPPVRCRRRLPLDRSAPAPAERAPIDQAFGIGVRAIDALLTIGRGQRVGLMAGSGVGKSSLLGMMARGASADVNVVALIGERGREVQDFVDEALGADGLARSIVVAVPADRPPLARLRGALYATALAEAFRDDGRDVFLMVDSLTRFAQAQREIGLAAGEMPVARGYPPSVFTELPRLLERAGGIRAGGSITAVYTVLAEGDDAQDPIVDSARAMLDGHILLSRELADAGHFPAIDIGASVSRTRSRVNDRTHEALTRRFLAIAATWREHADMVRAGLYRPGADPLLDEAMALRPFVTRFLQQSIDDIASIDDARAALALLPAATRPAETSNRE